jgi:hypothetical protein
LHAQKAKDEIYNMLISNLKENLSEKRIIFEVITLGENNRDISTNKENRNYYFGEEELYIDIDFLEARTFETTSYKRRVLDIIVVDVVKESKYCKISLSKHDIPDILINLHNPEIIIAGYDLVRTNEVDIEDANNIFNSAWRGLQWKFQNNLGYDISLTTAIVGNKDKLYLNININLSNNTIARKQQVRLIELN